LIVDIRYNGGGSGNIATYLASYIAPVAAQGQVFYQKIHNNNWVNMNKASVFSTKPLNIDLPRVLFITTGQSLSASELLINGLKPYMDVYVIGEPSGGKPVGMYQFDFGYYAFFPVTFRSANANGEGDYFNGLPVDVNAEDDLSRQFGDTLCPNIAQVLYFIENGAFDASKEKRYPDLRDLNKSIYKGWRGEIGAF